MPSRLVLQFLGLPQVFLDDKPIATDRRKAIALLAYLGVNDIGHPRQKYSRESLSALFWPDYEQAKAFANLRRVIWEVHQAIGEGWLLADRESVQLNVDAEVDLDVARFQDLLSQSCQQNDQALRIPPLSDAVKLYRDHFLTGFSLKDAPNFNEWAFAESEDLRRKLSDALTILSEDHCLLGQADHAIPYARRLVALDQLNESAHRQLMEIYWQAGQHSAALKQYQTCEQILRKELNLDPQPETRALYKKILKGDVKPVRVEKQMEALRPKNNLPLQLSSFIGREKEQEEIIDLVKKHRLVSLVGTGGIGKTRLSLEAAHQAFNTFPHGVWFIELAPLSDPALVPQTIISTLGLIEQANRPPETILADFLKEKNSLLILDNCEHLIQACAQLAEALLQICPNLHILATSREVLGIPGETVYLVPTLTTPDPSHSTPDISQYEAVQLFLERAQSALRDFSLTHDNASIIAQVCHHLDGIALALELAAARVKVLRVEEIAARLDDRFRLLTSGTRTALPRHQTLQAMIDWSHDLLTEQERVLLRRLSIFAGGWTLEAAEQVCADLAPDLSPSGRGETPPSFAGKGGRGLGPMNILDLLISLVNKSLVLAEREQGKETRYRMLETIRQYAREKLWEAGEGEVMRQRHLAYFVDLAERAEPNLRAFDMVMWLDRLEAELDNIRVALDWAQESNVESQLRLASALLWFWHIRGHRNEAIKWLERALSIEAGERGDQPLTPSRAVLRGKALNAIGFLLALAFEEEKATPYLIESLTMFQELGLPGKSGMAYALLRLGATSSAGSTAMAYAVLRLDATSLAGNTPRSMLEKSLELFRQIGDKFGIAECLMLLMPHTQGAGNYEEATKRVEEQLAVRREIGDLDGIATALGSLRDLANEQGDFQRAIALHEECVAIFRELGNKWAVGFELSMFGEMLLWQGDYERATETFEESLGFAQDVGDIFLKAYDSYNLGAIIWLRGDYARGAQMITESLAVFRDLDHHLLISGGLHALGDIALAQGDYENATQWYESELALGQQEHIELGLILALCGLGKVAWAKNDYELAENRFEEGLRLSQKAGLKLSTSYSLYGRGRVAQSRGDYIGAREFYAAALEIPRYRTDHPFFWASLKVFTASYHPLAALAMMAVSQNRMDSAVRLFGALEHSYKLIQFQQSLIERAEYGQAIATVRAALGEEAFAAAWEEGKKMTLEEAIAYALKEGES